MKKESPKILVILATLVGFLLVGLFLVFGSPVETAQASLLSSNAAISRALTYAYDDGFFGGLTAEPSRVFGKVMTQDEAMAFVTGHKLPDDAPRSKDAGKSVWLIVFQGSSVEHANSPAGSGKADVAVTHIVEAIDAVTGDPIVERMFGPEMAIDTSNLSELNLPKGIDVEIPTLALETSVPAATAEPAPAKSQ